MNIFPAGVWVPITFNASGDNTIVAATAGKATQVLALLITAAGATTITAKQGSTALTGAMSLATAGHQDQLFLPFTGVPYFTTAANAAFILNSSNAVQVSGMALVLTA